ncbi:MAG: hypothetical protein RL701_6282, partial [Pseudomonadota bacterium]
SVMDPAHRFFLEVAWEAVEHAGYTALPDEGAVGVFAGSGAPLYMMENLRTNPELMRSMGDFLVRHTGNDMNFLATRVSYEMDLRGPSINVQTACSSALTAVHMACQSLAQGDCALALAGGSTILVPQGQGYFYRDGEILSPDGHCRPFDAKSAGTVFGSGTGCVVLKRLQEALDDGDTIHAVIKGSAINNDGAVKVGYLAPGVDGQAAVIQRALEVAGVPAESISYVETHGTGTLVGDPIEVEALNQAFRPHTDKRHFCALGSVKSNIGHLGEAAAAASLIKAIMALKYRQLPPSLGYESPNPAIDFADSPFFVNDKLRPWSVAGDGRLRCGITALGAGGTNCHVILEEPPARIDGEGARVRQLLVISAKTRSALDQASENLALALERDASLELADVAYTLAVGRRAMPQRRSLTVHDREEAIVRLRARDAKQLVTEGADNELRVVFMFPGGGAQYARMGSELYAEESVYRDAVDACLELIQPELTCDLRALMFAPEAEAEAATRSLERPSLTLPALFTAEYALAKLLAAWGVTASAFIGHSMGEYVAACLSGVVSLHDALRLVMLRGRLFEKAERGGMLSVPLSEAELTTFMPRELSIAAVNGPELSVASGPVHAIETLQQALAARDIECTRIRIDVAAHSALLDPILDEFRTLCRSIAFQPPQVPFASNLTGRWITAAQATDPEYWVQHLRSTVRFADCLDTVLAQGERILVEVGPGRTLSMLARAQPKAARHVFNSMRHPQEAASDLEYALSTLGRIWSAGGDVDWSAFYDGQLRNRVPLPTYPFERQAYWVKPGKALEHAGASELVKRNDVNQWFYALSWVEAPLLRAPVPQAKQRWLVFAHDRAEGHDLLNALEAAGDDVVALATPGEQLASGHAESRFWWLDFRSPEQIAELFRYLEDHGQDFDRVLYLTGSTRHLPSVGPMRAMALTQALTQNFYGLTHVARAMGSLAEPLHLFVVTTHLADVDGRRAHIDPRRATALGPTLVTAREFPQIRTRCIDVPSLANPTYSRKLRQDLLDELHTESEYPLVALRPGKRWVQRVLPQAVPVAPQQALPDWLRTDGAYLITGGLGGIGLEVAQHMAQKTRISLVLLTRHELPPETRWDAILNTATQDTLRTQRIRKVRALRALGANVRVVVGDVGDLAGMRTLLTRLRAELGPLNGVIHAAGAMDDEPMQNKTLASMQRVLAPKVQGTLVLDELIRDRLDFFVLFSSVASFLGLPGQVDYTAANAFLDAFARERSRRAAGRTVVINWNAWRDVGMAEAARHGQAPSAVPSKRCAHPAIDGYSDEHSGRVFVTEFSCEKHWLLSEHRIKNAGALLPGTAFVELARAAFSVGRDETHGVELTNLMFLSPFQVAANETRTLCMRLTKVGDAHDISMHSGTDLRSPPHVIGEARTLDRSVLEALDLNAIRERCTREELPKGRFLDQDFMLFGPRWANIVRVLYGADEALLELELPREYAADLGAYGLHPALLDMATGGAQRLIPGVDLDTDFYVPMRYERVRVLGPMPARIFSHVRCLPTSGANLAYFDVSLSDEHGRVFVEISRFTMKRLDAQSTLTAANGGSVSRSDRYRQEQMDVLLRNAIAPSEGLEAFDRIMAQPALVQSVASSVDVLAWQAQLAAAGGGAQPSDATAEAPAGFSRPELDSTFVAPSSAAEQALATVWSELLGVQQIGVDDDFFDLGGNSLIAVRLFAAVKRQFRVSLPLSTLFEAPTIRQLSLLLDPSGAAAVPTTLNDTGGDARENRAADAESSTPALVTETDGYSPLVPIQIGAGVPVFCVHGAGGNVLNFRDLAKRFGAQQTFYGLQARGVTGGEPAAESIEEMAELYIDAVRKVRPRGPYVLSGYSGGGVVAFDMAQRLRAAGESVTLALFDTFHPATTARPPTRSERFEYVFAEGLSPYLARAGKAIVVRRLRGFANDLRIRYQPADAELPLELREMRITTAFDRAASRYVTKPYAGPVTLYKARTVNRSFQHVGPTLGWAEFIPQLDVVDVPGDHKSVMIEPNVQVVINHLSGLIAAASRPEPTAAAHADRGSEIAAQ